VGREDGPTAAADAVAACLKAGAADDVRLFVCDSTVDGEQYVPEPSPEPSPDAPPGKGWETKIAGLAGEFAAEFVKRLVNS
jgi:hypothetical protein